MLALRLPPDIEDRLNALAQRTGRTKTFYAREAILEHLDDWKTCTWRKRGCRHCAEATIRPCRWKS